MTFENTSGEPVAFPSAQRAFLLSLGPDLVDCVIAVMLKILDGKCKMPPDEAAIMTRVFDLLKARPARHLGAEAHGLIAEARAEEEERYRADVHEARVLAETRISRPVMKAFKAALRAQCVLPSRS